ncbi:MAG: hypothetical protein M9928_22350 [Anaerolineae bacterium]|nr:hypothetical protein [Anaerolineae bacterium]MCO5194907.1 hypothetical protein [Anaerolineae bacterium]MCO5207758.1 hypothetical protein [Anaerolineae bacterium]
MNEKSGFWGKPGFCASRPIPRHVICASPNLTSAELRANMSPYDMSRTDTSAQEHRLGKSAICPLI